MDYCERNTVWGFSERVVKNLTYLVSARAKEADVHVVTELITALLGLIVFPYAEIKESRYTGFQDYRLDDLAREGWPIWRFDIGSSLNLHEHIKHLRNAISHRRVSFSSDNRKLEDVEIRFADRPKGAAFDNWNTTINGAELQKFVLAFADLG